MTHLRGMVTALAFGLVLMVPSLAKAQWRYDETATEARAQVFGANGTSLGLRCTAAEIDQQHIYLDLLVIPVDLQPDPEEVAQFTIGSWTFDIETVPQERVGALYRYQSRFSYFDPVIENMRGRMMAGSVLRFTRTFDFAEMSFTLSGSRRAISALEAACPRLWARSRQPVPPTTLPQVSEPAPAPVPAPLPAQPSAVPPDALAALQTYVRSLMQPQCTAGSDLILPPDMFRASGDRVTVVTGLARCDWQVRVNPYCGAARCESWVYGWDGVGFNLLETSLR